VARHGNYAGSAPSRRLVFGYGVKLTAVSGRTGPDGPRRPGVAGQPDPRRQIPAGSIRVSLRI